MNDHLKDCRPRETPKATILPQFRDRVRSLFVLGKWLFTPFALAFLVMAFWQSRLIIRDILAHSLPIYFILAVLVWMVAHLISPMFSSIVLSAFGVKVGYRQVLHLHLQYLPARYIPGGVWHTVARVSGLHHLGVHPRYLSSLVILENLVAGSVTLTAGGILVGFYQHGETWQGIAWFSAVICMIILAMCPVLVNRLILKSVNKLRYNRYIAAVVITVFFWALATTSFLLFISALPNSFVILAWPQIVGTYLFSWGMGFIAIFAPQGVGVFEVVAADIMPTNLSFNALVALLAGFRLVVILADVLMWGGWVSRMYLKRPHQSQNSVNSS